LKVAVVGTGFVGAACAYAMTLRGSCREIVLVDKNHERAAAEANDILHATPVSHAIKIRAGGFDDITGASVVVLAAGVNQAPGETRLALLARNAAIFREIVPQVMRYAPEAVLIVATNPVDIMTALTENLAGKAARVFGTGTTLDTARFRALLGEHAGVDARHVHGYVVGEHGDSEVLAWSIVTVAGMDYKEFCRSRRIEFDAATIARIDDEVRHAAYKIIAGKGATAFGIGAVIARLVETVLRKERAIHTVSAHSPLHSVALSLPRLVGEAGVIDTIGVNLSPDENKKLETSATVLRDFLAKL
jgi:L-lactate dehydrogenase